MNGSKVVFDRKHDWGVDLGDAREWGWKLPKNSLSCVVTSPPYYALRKYLPDGSPDADKEIGRQETPEEYVEQLVEVFRGVKRGLHPTGSLWLNLGDSFNQGAKGGAGGTDPKNGARRFGVRPTEKGIEGLKAKDLIGIPWMVAFALRADGWYLRQWMPWVKRNPMPESVEDRPGAACETVFLLTKEPDYFFDMRAAKRIAREGGRTIAAFGKGSKVHGAGDSANPANCRKGLGRGMEVEEDRNFRSADLWFDSVGMLFDPYSEDETILGLDVNTNPYKGSHFAVMPKKLIRPMILAGTSEKGVCPHCGAPWTRQIEKVREATRPGTGSKVLKVAHTQLNRPDGANRSPAGMESSTLGGVVGNRDPERHVTKVRTVGWEPSCGCANNTPIPAIVGDPFAGSGTVLAVARENGRRAVGCELNPDYLKLIQKRVGGATPPLF